MKLFYKTIILAILMSTPCYAYMSKIDVTNNAFEHNTIGIENMQSKNYSNAIQEFIIAISLMPDNSVNHPVYNNLGIAYMELAKGLPKYNINRNCYLRHAEGAFVKAIQLYPVSFNYYKNLVDCYEMQGKLNIALKKFEHDKNLYSPIITALIYKKMGQNAKASEIVNKFSAKNPDLIMAKNLKNYF